jgi:hypothetical protein
MPSSMVVWRSLGPPKMARERWPEKRNIAEKAQNWLGKAAGVGEGVIELPLWKGQKFGIVCAPLCLPVGTRRGNPNAKSLPYQDPSMPRSPRPSCRWSKSEGRCRAHPVSGTPNALPLETIGNRVKPYLRFFSRGALSRTFFRYPNRSSSLTSSTALPTCSRNRRKIDSRRTHDPKLSTP